VVQATGTVRICGPDGQAQRAPAVRADHFSLGHDEPAAAVRHAGGGRGVARRHRNSAGPRLPRTSIIYK